MQRSSSSGCAGNRAARRADPEAKVFGPDTCGLNPGWLEEVYKALESGGFSRKNKREAMVAAP